MIQQFYHKFCPFCKEDTTFDKIEICESCFNAILLKERWQMDEKK